jgi:hypothetical protein
MDHDQSSCPFLPGVLAVGTLPVLSQQPVTAVCSVRRSYGQRQHERTLATSPVSEMIRPVAEAFVDVKMQRADVFRSLVQSGARRGWSLHW